MASVTNRPDPHSNFVITAPLNAVTVNTRERVLTHSRAGFGYFRDIIVHTPG